jgi:hypothetical protein
MRTEGDFSFSLPGIVSMRWDPDGELVLVEWEGWADGHEFEALLEAEIQGLVHNRGSRLLADCRLQRVLSPIEQDRANREWLPRALDAGLKRFAVVLPTSVLAAMNLRDRLGQVPDPRLDVAFFAGIDEARAWITR